MDAVYAWDQPDLHFYVPCGDHFSDPADFCFQKTLGVAAVAGGGFGAVKAAWGRMCVAIAGGSALGYYLAGAG